MRWLTLAWLSTPSGLGRTDLSAPDLAPVRLGGASHLALEILLEDDQLRSPEKLSSLEALGALDVLTRTLGDEHDAVAAFVLGPSRWRMAMDHALARQAHTGSAPETLSELDSRARGKVLEAWERFDAWRDRLTLAWPLAEPCRVTSGFGPRHHPILRRVIPHEGIDLAAPVGTPVHAAQDGKVIGARVGRASGRTLVVDHGEGLVTEYYHLDAQLVTLGSEVARGQLIARSGATGRVTGPHLHFVVSLEGVPLDPARLRPPRDR